MRPMDLRQWPVLLLLLLCDVAVPLLTCCAQCFAECGGQVFERTVEIVWAGLVGKCVRRRLAHGLEKELDQLGAVPPFMTGV